MMHRSFVSIFSIDHHRNTEQVAIWEQRGGDIYESDPLTFFISHEKVHHPIEKN